MTAPGQARKVVLYGDYPPFSTPAATTILAAVRGFLAEGREVEVVSPRPSAAHHHADIATIKGATRILRLVAGADLMAWIDLAAFTGGGGPVGPAARTSLGLILRRAATATLHLAPLPAAGVPGWARSAVAPATSVIAASEADARALVRAGFEAASVSVEDQDWWHPLTADPFGPGEQAPVVPTETWNLPERAGRETVEAEVRRRAAEHRETESASPVAAAWPLHMLAPLAPAPTESSKPLFRLVKRGVHRLVAWHTVPIVEQLNHLQRATIEAFDRQAEAQRPADTSS